jgi:propionate CoA-transferase
MKWTNKVKILYTIARWRLTWDKRDTAYKPAGLGPKFVSALEAVAMIPDGAVVESSGMAANARCSIFYWAIKERFQAEGHPKGLTWVALGAMGSRGRVPGTIEELDFPGPLALYIGGHLETMKAQLRLADAGELTLATLPQGIMGWLMEAQARGEDSILSEVGVGTVLDPRIGSGSQVIPGKGPQLITAEGDRLRYTMPKLDVALFVLPYADAEGNLYAHEAATLTESLPATIAVKKNGGKVLASVSSIIPKDPQRIYISADKVDAIVVNPRSEQTGAVPQCNYWPLFTVGSCEDIDEGVAQLKFVNQVMKITPVRTDAENALARLAAKVFARLVRPGANINIGVGLPEEVSRLVYEGGLYRDVTFGTETGVLGGLPAPGIFFGAAVCPEKMMSSAEIFHYWEDKLDLTILGLLEADSDGNVNVSKRGEGAINYVGPGGFPNLVNSAKNVLFIGSWMAHADFAIEDGKLVIKKAGVPKFIERVSQITFSGKQAVAQGKNVYYVTNIGVFHLTARGMELTEVMPGIDVKKDVIDSCPMKIVLPEGEVPVVDQPIVTGEGYKLTWPKP